MKNLKVYKFRSINEYDTEEPGFDNASYYQFEFHENYYTEKLKRGKDFIETEAFPPDHFWGTKNNLPVKEPVLFFTSAIEDEHFSDESIPDEYTENMEVSGQWKMPLMSNLHRFWLVREDVLKVICNLITIEVYELFDAEIYNSHLNKTFTNYKILHFLNIDPNMELSQYKMSKYFKIPRPEYSKMVFNSSDFEYVIATEQFHGGPFVTEAFKKEIEGFSNELTFDFMDFDNSELDLSIYAV